MLGLIDRMLHGLDAEGVRYCHWKSNEAIERSLSGDNDLDLLVARADESQFNAVLDDLGFRAARPGSERLVPGLVDHFGVDPETGRIVHVQAHYQLVFGDDMTKNFRLPIEEEYLDRRCRIGPIYIADASLELLVFVLRMVLKHCPVDAQAARKGRLTPSERRELADLVERADASTVEGARQAHVPIVSKTLFADCLRAIEADAGHLRRAWAGERLIRALAPLGRERTSVDRRRRILRRMRWARQAGSAAGLRRLDAGGSLIAVVGGDGSGKSSTVAALASTFGRYFPTQTVHLGKPPRSMSSRLLRRALRHRSEIDGFTVTSLPAWTDFSQVGFPGYRWALFHVLNARDRARAARQARRAADDGWLVICDRFPLPELRSMDGPRLDAASGVAHRRSLALLSRLESLYYQRIGTPDVLLVLRVSPDIAVRRRYDQDGEFVRRRAAEVFERSWAGTGAIVLDAGRDQAAVLAAAMTAVWSGGELGR